MARHCTVLSGDFVLKIIQHGQTYTDDVAAAWQPATLDVSCGAGSAAGEFASYLEQREGYTTEIVSNPVESATPPSDNPHVVCIIRLTRNPSLGRGINIIASSSPSSTHRLPTAWNTTLMAFISANGLNIPFPDHMRRSIGFLNPLSSSPLQHVQELIGAYQLRGLRTFRYTDSLIQAPYRDHYPAAGHHAYCPHTRRSFVDDACYHLPFTSQFMAMGRRKRGHHVVEWVFGGQECSTCQHEFTTGQLFLTRVRHEAIMDLQLIRYVLICNFRPPNAELDPVRNGATLDF